MIGPMWGQGGANVGVYVGSMWGQGGAKVKPMLGQSGGNVGPRLGHGVAKVKPMWGQCWVNLGLMWGQGWAKVEPRWSQSGAYVGPMLAFIVGPMLGCKTKYIEFMHLLTQSPVSPRQKQGLLTDNSSVIIPYTDMTSHFQNFLLFLPCLILELCHCCIKPVNFSCKNIRMG